jgi:ATP-dependent Clp protease ATP-binding subunit ClpA
MTDRSELSATARRAVASAETEARGLGHARVGTEHLLLGLLANEPGGTARVLREAGVTLSAARHKVADAVGRDASGAALASGDPLPRTARAERALSRAVRFSHARQADEVGTEHVLLGILDVEGTAGQVLRGLGVDVERLRAAIERSTQPEPEPEPEPAAPPAACPACRAALGDGLAYELVTASGPRGDRTVVLLTCTACGAVVGSHKA